MNRTNSEIHVSFTSFSFFPLIKKLNLKTKCDAFTNLQKCTEKPQKWMFWSQVLFFLLWKQANAEMKHEAFSKLAKMYRKDSKINILFKGFSFSSFQNKANAKNKTRIKLQKFPKQRKKDFVHKFWVFPVSE